MPVSTRHVLSCAIAGAWVFGGSVSQDSLPRGVLSVSQDSLGHSTGGPTSAMTQELEALQSQLAQHQVTLSSLSDSIVRLDQTVTHTAGTPDGDGNSLVRLPFMNERLRSFEAETQSDQSRLNLFTREMSDLREMVTDANDAVHRRIDGERSTNLATMENLDKGYATLRDLVSLRHRESKEDREALMSLIKALEERVSGLRTSPGWGTSRICLTRQKGVRPPQALQRRRREREMERVAVRYPDLDRPRKPHSGPPHPKSGETRVRTQRARR